MKVLVLLALVVCAVAAMPMEERDEELAKRLVDIMHEILGPLMTLLSKETTEHACESVCKNYIHTHVNIPYADLACGPACKEVPHLGTIQG